MWARESVASKVHKAKGRFSFYHDLIAKVWAQDAGEVTAAPLNRICTLARKMGVRYVVVEDALARQTVADELGALERAVGGEGSVKAVSVSFLHSDPTMPTWEENDRALIGQCVVVTYPREGKPHSYIVEAVFRRPQQSPKLVLPLLNNHVPFVHKFPVRVLGRQSTLEGIFFRQGNRATISAPAAAILTIHDWERGGPPPAALRQGEEGTALSRPIAAIDALVKESGINIAAYEFKPSRTNGGREGAWSSAAALVESGSPVLVIAEGQDGSEILLPVFGYTINSDEWHPVALAHYETGAKALSSSLWVDHLVVHDPNIGPYLCLSRAWFDDRRSRSKLRPQSLFVRMERGLKLSPAYAERLAEITANHWISAIAAARIAKGRWWKRLVLERPRFVLRTTKATRDDYSTHLHNLFRKKAYLADKDYLKDYIMSLPEVFWMTEITLPQLFVGNRKKLGEFIVSADADPETASTASVVAARLPSILVRRASDSLYVDRVRLAEPCPLLHSAQVRNDW